MKRYRCIKEYVVPVGTVLLLEPQFDMYDKEVRWVYEYSVSKDGKRKFGNLSIINVEENPEHFELIKE
jgi:hypothetical protein